jgi:hypothetical protein
MNSGPNVPKWPVCSRQPCLSWLDPAAATHAADSPAGHGLNQQQRGWWQLFGSSSNCHSGVSCLGDPCEKKSGMSVGMHFVPCCALSMWGAGQCFGCAGPCRGMQETAHAVHSPCGVQDSVLGVLGHAEVCRRPRMLRTHSPCGVDGTRSPLHQYQHQHLPAMETADARRLLQFVLYERNVCVCVEALLKSTFRNQH